MAETEQLTSLRSGFAHACEELGGATTLRAGIAGGSLEVACAGPALASIVERAIGAIRRGELGRRADLRVELWAGGGDFAGSRVRGAPSAGDGIGRRSASPDGRFLRYESESSVLLADWERGLAVGACGSVEALSQYERGRPLHPALEPWLASRGTPILHAGLVSIEGRGVLLPGPGGTGKTTATLACAAAGLDWVAEDVLAVSRAPDGGVRGHGIYATAKLDAAGLRLLPRLAGAVSPSEGGEPKSLVYVEEALPGRLRPEAPIEAIALPRLGEETRLLSISRGEALRELLAGSLAAVPPTRRRDTFELLGALVSRAPVARLELGGGPSAVPAALAELLGPGAGGAARIPAS